MCNVLACKFFQWHMCTNVDSVHNRTRYIWVQTWTVQYTTAQTLRKSPRFRRSVHRFSTQPHKICLGVGIDGCSVHNRSELIVTQAHFKRKASSVLRLRSMHFAVVPGGVRRSVHRFSTQPHKICLVVDMDGSVHNRTNLEKVTPVPEVSTPIQYTTAQTLRKSPWFRRSVPRFSTQPHKP